MKQLLTALIIICSFFTLGAKMAKAESLSNKFSGMILLQVESRGEAWYINPTDQSRCYLGKQDDAFKVMRELGLGIKHDTLTKYLKTKFPSNLSGKILLDVEKSGEAYYVYPKDNKGYYLGKPNDAYKIMREKGLGISNVNLDKIKISEKYKKTDSKQTNINTEVPTDQYLIDLIKNPEWSMSLQTPKLGSSFGPYFEIARNNETLSIKTYTIDQNTGEKKESAGKYSIAYTNKLDPYTLKYTEYVELNRSWYDYPTIKAGFNYISYYVPIIVKNEKPEGIRESHMEIGDTRSDDKITFEIIKSQKAIFEINCIVRGQTKSTGKFYYTQGSKRFKSTEYFKCFNSEDEAQKDGYTKSFDN